jgi:hypothetical protein
VGIPERTAPVHLCVLVLNIKRNCKKCMFFASSVCELGLDAHDKILDVVN